MAVSAHAAYVHGMDVVLLVCGIAAVLSALITALRLPGRTAGAATSAKPVREESPA